MTVGELRAILDHLPGDLRVVSHSDGGEVWSVTRQPGVAAIGDGMVALRINPTIRLRGAPIGHAPGCVPQQLALITPVEQPPPKLTTGPCKSCGTPEADCPVIVSHCCESCAHPVTVED